MYGQKLPAKFKYKKVRVSVFKDLNNEYTVLLNKNRAFWRF